MNFPFIFSIMTHRAPSKFYLWKNWSPLFLAAFLALPTLASAQNNLPIYADALTNGWQDWSYNCTRNYTNLSPVHAGSDSVSALITNAYGGIQLHHSAMTNTAYGSISFWLHGGSSGGQSLQMYGNLNIAGSDTAQSARYYLNPPVANSWQQYTVPLSALGVANTTNFAGFAIQDSNGSAEPIFYLDDIQLVNANGPAITHLTVNASQPVRTADARWFGMNAAQWDNAFDNPATLTQLASIGTRALRFPGGSNSDDYHWLYNRQATNTWKWATSLANFIHIVTNAQVATMITVNYGTGSTNEAAAWVAYCNAATSNLTALGTDSLGTNWNTAGTWAALRAATPLGTDDGKNFLRLGRSAPLGFKYWEIGNEEYGTWEIDSNSLPHDPYTYAVRAANYLSRMKAVDPTIKIGVVVTTGEDSYANNSLHPVVNPRTGVTHNGWTPVLLATLKSLGATPDFLIHHVYPQNPGGESDAGLLAATSGWASNAGNLRQMITDYFGASGTNIELVCTENNSVSSSPGKQTTSLVNGLFLADSLAQLMQTEFNGLFWWNFRNGGVETNNLSATLYGWRNYGEYGIVDGTNYYPTFYTAKLLTNFVQAGDTVLTTASDFSLLPAYAVRRQNGSLTILAINKDPVNTLTGLVAVAGYQPAATASIFAYGKTQDNAANSGIGSPDVAQTHFVGAGTNFTFAFPSYSATVFVLAPVPAKLSAPVATAAGQFVFQLAGQTGVPYVIQRSTNLVTWSAVSTNTLTSSSVNLTNALSVNFPQQFWRAVWLP